MAGTGKSTISRTVAQVFAAQGQLGASFFFKRGESERGNASRFFTTIAAQLLRRVPPIVPFVRKAIDADDDISGKSMKDQFEKLIFQPLSEIGQVPAPMSKLVIVIDALDECDREGDIRDILDLLSQTKHLKSVRIRIFLTSRPEFPIRLAFTKLSSDLHQDEVLQNITQDTIKDDISAFLRYKFAKIRDDYNCLHSPGLPASWPDEGNIQALTKMAIPLFIFAATICRFVRSPQWNPKNRLDHVLKYQTGVHGLERTYLPVLDQLLTDPADSEKEKNLMIQEFREIVGSIILLADPLSTSSLERLLGIDLETIDGRLGPLHSVLSIPANSDSPVRLFHLSFRDFLLDREKYGRNESWFWIDERKTHEMLATRCIRLMSGPNCLRENICRLDSPGKLRGEIDSKTVDKRLPADLRYACRYWVYHLEQSKASINDQSEVYNFLQEHFLHWLEVLSLIGVISESDTFIGTLQSLIAVSYLMERTYSCIYTNVVYLAEWKYQTITLPLRCKVVCPAKSRDS
jgi:hypothetical protein